ncbi:MAG TPA: hypothetical protein VM370_12860 [Candidatus Thermoplasmatota archaeon]|nr:hypothetical protein [Candidatus Thermoplasmatota archaeon]
MVESVVWTIDWNPEFEDEARLKREILRSLNSPKTMGIIKRFAESASREAAEDGMETEHIVWLDSALSYAFFVRVWFDLGEQKLFILVEENDLGDVGFLLLEDLACASYAESDEGILKVEFTDPEDLGVPP